MKFGNSRWQELRNKQPTPMAMIANDKREITGPIATPVREPLRRIATATGVDSFNARRAAPPVLIVFYLVHFGYRRPQEMQLIENK
jgi:hypothetical protein